MTRILLIPCGKTFWTEEGRLAGSADLPLSKQGYQDAHDTARRIAEGYRPQVIYTGPAQALQETVDVIAQALGIKTKTHESLHEPDMGLWEGLTAQDLQQRSPRAYRQLAEEPTTVSPPGGEPLDEALARLVEAVDHVVEKHRNQTVGLLIGPLAEFLLQSWIHSPAFEEHWAGRDKPEVTVITGGATIIPDIDHQ